MVGRDDRWVEDLSRVEGGGGSVDREQGEEKEDAGAKEGKEGVCESHLAGCDQVVEHTEGGRVCVDR